jgi:IclR family pca regulon transcriptional regulator/IclR family acetate operon transcriptional repressor
MTETTVRVPAEGKTQPGGMRSLERSLDVLEALAHAGQPQRLVDIAQATRLSPATALRILNVLERRQFVIAENLRYRLGVVNLVTAYGFTRDDALSSHAKRFMQELAAATGLSVALQVRYGLQRVPIARVSGKDPLRYELPNGRPLPLHLGAGKVFAAHMERPEFDALIASVGSPMRTIRGEVFTPEDLWLELQQIRAQGFHVSEEERAVGTRSLGVPVTDASGGVIALLALLSPTETHTRHDLEALVPEVTRAAHAIGRLT